MWPLELEPRQRIVWSLATLTYWLSLLDYVVYKEMERRNGAILAAPRRIRIAKKDRNNPKRFDKIQVEER